MSHISDLANANVDDEIMDNLNTRWITRFSPRMHSIYRAQGSKTSHRVIVMVVAANDFS